MNDLFEEGLIDPTTFSQKSDQMQQVIRSDEKRVFGYTADHFGMGIDVENRDLNKAISAMIPVEGPTGARYQLHQDYVDMSSNYCWFITDKCEEPEAAFKVGEYLLSDEALMIQQYGEEGVGWERLDSPTESILSGVDAIYSIIYNEEENEKIHRLGEFHFGLQLQKTGLNFLLFQKICMPQVPMKQDCFRRPVK